MTSMRLRLKLRGIRTWGYLYTWAQENWDCIFIEDSINLISSAYYYERISHVTGYLPTTETLVFTDQIIYPNIVKAVTIMDGTVRGQLKYKYRVADNPSGKLWITKIIISMYNVDMNNNETELKSHTINPNIWTQETTLQDVTFLYFFHIDNQKLLSNERLKVNFALYCKHTDTTNSPEYEIKSMATINTDERSIDIPIV